MCQHIIILAERSSQQYISQCEHGTVNLVWDGVGIHLPAAQFVLLAERVQRTHATLPQSAAAPDGCFHLQVGKLMMMLPMTEFTPLVDLLSTALPAIHRGEAKISRRIPQLRFPTHPLANVLN